MTITCDITELNNIDIELRRLRKEMKKLRELRGKCEERIGEFLKAHDHPGVIFNGVKVVSKTKVKREYVSKSDRISRAHQFLSKFGVNESDITKLFDEIRGNATEKATISIEK